MFALLCVILIKADTVIFRNYSVDVTLGYELFCVSRDNLSGCCNF